MLGTVGEPINPKAWLWYYKVIGGERCPIVDTWWQTETGSIMISPLPGITSTKPGSATLPFPGILAEVVDEQDGKPINEGQGLLVLKRPWPSMLRTIYKEDDRFVETYFAKFGKETYFVGDAARKDKDGYFWVIGRVDDVVNVSGTGSQPPRSNPRSSPATPSPKPQSSAKPTTSPAKRSPRS